jgi:plasmid stabilization system protein ParE
MHLTHLVLYSFLSGAGAPGLTPVAREVPQSVEFLVQVGDVRIGTWAHVGASWLLTPELWLTTPDAWLSLRPSYRPALLDPGVVEVRLQRTSYGFQDVSLWRFTVDNLDGRYNALWNAQGQPVTRWRHDRRASPPVTIEEFTGVLDRVTILICEATSQDLSALDTLIPARLTSTDLFGESCPEPGVPIKKVIGDAKKVRLPYVIDDTVQSIFWYGPLEGSVTITAVYRNRIGTDQVEQLDPSEYEVAYHETLRWTAVRTYRRQSATGGGFHALYADVSSPATERSPAVALGLLMNDPTWGCGQPVDWAAVMTEAALLPAELRVDGVIGWDEQQRPARDYLDWILMLRGGRPVLDRERGWRAEFDSLAATESMMVLRDDAGPGERTLLEIGQREMPPLNERVKTLRLRYGWDDPTQALLYSAADRAVSDKGRVEIIENPMLSDPTSADHAAHYIALRKGDEADLVRDAVVHEGGRRIRPGDIVHAICPQLQIDGEDRLVIGVALDAGRQRLHHIRHSPAKYTHVAGALPTPQVLTAAGGALVAPFGNVNTAADAVENAVRIVTADLEVAEVDFAGDQEIVSTLFQSEGGAVMIFASATMQDFVPSSGAPSVSIKIIVDDFATPTNSVVTPTMSLPASWADPAEFRHALLDIDVTVLSRGTHKITLQGVGGGGTWTAFGPRITIVEFRR